jgi:methionyl-tRNA formyltransferase
LDTGPVLLRQSTQIGDKETAPNLMKRLSNMGADLLSETIKEFETIVPEKQDSSKATFAPILTREDGLIDWNLSAAVIERMIRGLQPWPNAFTFFDGKRMVITNSDPTDNSSEDELPGTVLYAHGDSIIIACGDGSSLRVNEIQPEGKRRMSTREFLNGLHVRSGMRFG